MSQDRQVATIQVAKSLIQNEAKRFQAALTSDPASGRICPHGWEQWYTAVVADFEREPKLLEAASQAPNTVLECLSVCAGAGLIPGAGAGEFYLIPRWNGARRRTECTFIIGYKGLTAMALRHPRVHKCEGFLVYEGEPFEWEPGRGHLLHKVLPDIDRSDDKIRLAYSRVVLTMAAGTHTDPEPLVWMMNRAELLEARDKHSEAWRAYKAGKIKSTSWADHLGPQCRKTVMRRHLTGGSVPRANQLIMAVAAEDRQEESFLEPQTTAGATIAVGGQLRQALGIVDPEPAGVPDEVYDSAEAAVEWVRAHGADGLDLGRFHGADLALVEGVIALETAEEAP